MERPASPAPWCGLGFVHARGAKGPLGIAAIHACARRFSVKDRAGLTWPSEVLQELTPGTGHGGQMKLNRGPEPRRARWPARAGQRRERRPSGVTLSCVGPAAPKSQTEDARVLRITEGTYLKDLKYILKI